MILIDATAFLVELNDQYDVEHLGGFVVEQFLG